ncbi:MAG TPA: hypothetical protein VI488_09870 [Candidatus Angelobacter sp.]
MPKVFREVKPKRIGIALFIVAAALLSTAGRITGQTAADETGAKAAGSKFGESATAPSQTTAGKANADQDAQVPAGPALIHIVPFGPPATPPKTRRKPIGGSSNNGTVQYWGGPVISNVQVVEVMWGNFVDVASTTGLEQFFTDITQSNYFDMLAEYSTVGLTGLGGAPGTNQTIGLGTFLSPRITISPSLCPGAGTNPPCTITDAQIETEIVNQLNAHHLPAPVQDNQGNFDTVYMVYFPPGVTIILSPGVNSCQQGGFCAYHSNVALNSQPKLPYGVFPDFSPAGACGPIQQGCGSGTSQQNLSSASSHELAEAVTDVEVGSFNGTVAAPPLAWVDQNSGEEIGDFCNHDEVQITVNSHTYTVQSILSNMQQGCVSAPGHFQVQPAIAGSIPGAPFQVTVTAESSSGFQLPGYNDTIHFTSTDPSAVVPADYTFVPNDSGVHTFTVTLNTTGTQTVTANDTLINAMAGTGSVDIEHNPDLTVASAHAGSFKQGDTGDVYTITVTNVGDRPTNALVTVTESQPFAMMVTNITGAGWSCNMSTLTCTRAGTAADALAAGASYPPITMTVNVSVTAPPTVTNTVQVSGGGEVNTTNDSASDVTTIVQFPDLAVFKGHTGLFSQGQIGASYTLAVQNQASVPTSGTVTLTDQLPTGLTATAISGSGWSCSTPPTLSCTRSDALQGGGTYPLVTLTVNVDASAPMPQVVNTATVSGGGEINTANDTATDPTAVIPPTPDVAISATHTATLTQGQTGATYTLTVTNVGPAPTIGSVTVTDSLPLFFTATAIAGNGWTCSTPPTLSCSRSDPLAAFTGGTPPAYPPVTVTFNIAPNAISPETNFANVCCGGEAMGSSQNDIQVDQLNVIQLPNMVVAQNMFQVLAQGLNGVTYNLIASNSSSASTSGTVTVVDTLPSGLTATAISGSGWNCTLGNLTCTRNDSLGPNLIYPPIVMTVSVAANAPSSVTNTVTVSGGGEIITSDDTSTLTSPVLPPIGINPFNNKQTVTAGNSATFLLVVNAPLPGAVTVACSSGVPPGAACVISPASFTAPFNGDVSITVTTTSALGLDRPWPGTRTAPLYAALIACLGLVAMRAGKNRRGARFAVFCTLALVLCCPGCGGGGPPPPPPPPVATPPGTYTITVTVNNTTANTQASTPLTLTVQ